MEVKQLEFFLACVERGSLTGAAEKLYTTQPNVSKVIRTLEEELHAPLFDRTSRGIELTEFGRLVYRYACDAMSGIHHLERLADRPSGNAFCVSTYQSNTMMQLLVDLYEEMPGMRLEHRRGSTEEILMQVKRGLSEIGILAVTKKHSEAFLRQVQHAGLSFQEIAERTACVYAGPHSELYDRESLSYEDLVEKPIFIGPMNDYFSIEDDLRDTKLGNIENEFYEPVVHTNSEHLTRALMMRCNVAVVGIDFDPPEGTDTGEVRKIPIVDRDLHMILGAAVRKEHVLSHPAARFLEMINDYAGRV
ncbi:MAG: LysR family transcriptional regulator [Eubacteriales bacterium]|nr:LysR family transcriptional regulator [Eubacteriales bacterium]